MATTQKKMILEHLKRFGSIEPLTALGQYGVYRLAAVVASLRKDGEHIKTETLKSTNRITGKPVHFANYILQ